MQKFVYGVDFGTSNSALAIMDAETRSIVKTFNEGSLLYFPEDKTRRHYVGTEALEQYFGNNMRGRFMKSLKTILPRSSFSYTLIDGKAWFAEDLAALIIGYLKKTADEFTGQDITSAVFGRPVVFDDDPDKDRLAEERLLKAAQRAGFKEIHFQYEPIAAAFTYERQLARPELVLVGDLGGGTSDFTLMRLDPAKFSQPNRKGDMIAKGGIHVAGDELDARVMWEKVVPHFGYGVKYRSREKMLELPVNYFRSMCTIDDLNDFRHRKNRRALDVFLRETGFDERFARFITLIDHNLGYSLLSTIERSKMKLSSEDETWLRYEKLNICLNERMTLPEFNRIIEPDVSSISGYLDGFLRKSGVSKNEVESVFITGGSSLTRSIRNVFTERFGKDKIRSGDSFNSVAYGLAYSASLF
jgi:hypothetical chaperone protein